MKKMMSVGLAAIFAAGFVSAEDSMVMVDQSGVGGSEGPQATAEISGVSSYVFRGMVLNNDFVFQPQFTIAHKGVSFNIWGNYNTKPGNNSVESELSEIDLSLAYSLPLNLENVAVDVGAISYQYPGNGIVKRDSTMELYVAAHLLTFSDFFIPSITYYGDVKEVDGSYFEFDVVAPIEFTDVMSLDLGASTGWGNARYNSGYFGEGANDSVSKGFNNYNVYGTLNYEAAENITVSLNLTYTGVYGGAIEENAGENYEADHKVWGGFNVAYDF